MWLHTRRTERSFPEEEKNVGRFSPVVTGIVLILLKRADRRHGTENWLPCAILRLLLAWTSVHAMARARVPLSNVLHRPFAALVVVVRLTAISRDYSSFRPLSCPVLLLATYPLLAKRRDKLFLCLGMIVCLTVDG